MTKRRSNLRWSDGLRSACWTIQATCWHLLGEGRILLLLCRSAPSAGRESGGQHYPGGRRCAGMATALCGRQHFVRLSALHQCARERRALVPGQGAGIADRSTRIIRGGGPACRMDARPVHDREPREHGFDLLAKAGLHFQSKRLRRLPSATWRRLHQEILPLDRQPHRLANAQARDSL
jgi:hypothetical protein